MKSKRQIIEALRTLQEVCKEVHSCFNCPLSDKEGACLVSNDDGGLNPCEWNIKTSEEVWKAFLD